MKYRTPLFVIVALLSASPILAIETNFNRTAGEMKREIDNHLAAAQTLLDQILAVDGDRNVKNTLVPMNEMNIHLSNAASKSELLSAVHPEKSVREAADAGSQAVAKFATELSLNRDLFNAVQTVDVSKSDAETKRVVFRTLRDFRRSGVDRDDETRQRVKMIQDDIVKIGQQFDRNIAEDVRHIKLDSPGDLAGLPDDYIRDHAPGDDGKITITTNYPDYVPFMKYADSTDARRRMYDVYRHRGFPNNLEALSKLTAKRHELATLLGYNNWAEYITEDKMIGNDEAVEAFINKIAELAKPPSRNDITELLAYKKQHDPAATQIFDYEAGYFAEKVKGEKFNFSSQEARPYFEFGRVQQGLFDVTGRLFNIQFRPAGNVRLWHENVTCWDLYDGDKILGRFLLDLHPREGKYKHAACFTYQTGVKGKQIPINALVCNFPNPKTTSGPAMMEHGDVVTFFHEFGHLLHAIFAGHHEWVDVGGISTEWDFVEAPSQMLEEWCWNVDVLQMFGKHHRTNEPIPAEMVAKMRAASDFGKATWVRQQMFYASMSLNFHNQDPTAFYTTDLVKELAQKYAPYAYVPDTYMHCAFGHLNGYSAIYYTYMWSLVIAKDMFSEFEKNGIFDKETARRYRRAVLSTGGSDDAANLVEQFLGRPYRFNAYGDWLKGKPKR